jgi:hypothetical protein
MGQQQTELVTLIVTATAAVLLGHQHAEEPHLSHLLEDVHREGVLAVALRQAGADALLGEAADLVAEELLVLVEGEVDTGGGGPGGRGACGGRLGEHGHGGLLPGCFRFLPQALLSTQSAITIFWISLVPS